LRRNHGTGRNKKRSPFRVYINKKTREILKLRDIKKWSSRFRKLFEFYWEAHADAFLRGVYGIKTIYNQSKLS
jgi:hypothetical protein